MRLALCFCFLFVLVAASVSGFAGTTYYIDCSTGSDNNNGTTKLTPWAHAPGMTGTVKGVGPGTIDIANGSGGMNCGSGSCTLAGDQFIFKGGATCGAADFPWTWRESGTSASPLYIGVDKTWYAGSSWTRPILDPGGAAGNLCGNATTAASSSTCHPVLQLAPVTYVILDNLEWTDLYWYASGTGNSKESYIAMPANATHVEIKNQYMHGWAHHAYSSGANPDVCNLMGGDTEGLNAGSSFHDNVIDGSDTTKDACVAVWGGPPTIYNNVIRQVSNGAIMDAATSFHDNLIEYVNTSYDTTMHMNGFESNASYTLYVYNNIIRHLGSGALGMWLAPYSGYTVYVFNNLIYDTDVSNSFDVSLPVGNGTCTGDSQGYCPAGQIKVTNNTFECGPDSNPQGSCGGCPSGASSSRGYAYQGCVFQNNHFITNNSAPLANLTYAAMTANNNVAQTQTAATAQSYTVASQFSPSQSAPVTVTTQGVNLGPCSGALLPQCSDLNGTPRPASGNWNIGAYQGEPVPPTHVNTAVQ
jgi:hypothetical protein